MCEPSRPALTWRSTGGVWPPSRCSAPSERALGPRAAARLTQRSWTPLVPTRMEPDFTAARLPQASKHHAKRRKTSSSLEAEASPGAVATCPPVGPGPRHRAQGSHALQRAMAGGVSEGKACPCLQGHVHAYPTLTRNQCTGTHSHTHRHRQTDTHYTHRHRYHTDTHTLHTIHTDIHTDTDILHTQTHTHYTHRHSTHTLYTQIHLTHIPHTHTDTHTHYTHRHTETQTPHRHTHTPIHTDIHTTHTLYC